eukprot:CAMPEP_0183729942 /NCGR_PEP_ID=MMETSP0737-20130205/31581_1 /TAXON_ID=385413 /ORGANISM="Thalassiosira miniscula, Strain CCMP1093" /LENGTH=244 /DNA_ID=CAMNT_0025962271 /DNA_START=14 /DNA_END=748 /DNA_ORIENTATION=+
MTFPIYTTNNKYQRVTATASNPPPAVLNIFTTAKLSSTRVHFKPTVTIHPIDNIMDKEEKGSLCYSKEELHASLLEDNAIDSFSKRAPRSHLLGDSAIHDLSKESSSCEADAVVQKCMLDQEAEEANPALRGLELDLFPIRARNKKLAHRALLEYQKQLNSNPNKTSEEKIQSMAAASAKLSNWSKLVAIETARLDSLRIYESEYLIPINDPVDVSLSLFPVVTKRRRVTIDEDREQAKRSRQC